MVSLEPKDSLTQKSMKLYSKSLQYFALLLTICQNVAIVSSFQSTKTNINRIPYSIKSKHARQKISPLVPPSSEQHVSSTTALKAIPPIPSLSSITSPIGSLSVLAFVILIHELGHFLAARSFNINVKEFSVGVGPKIVGFKRNMVTGQIEIGSDKQKAEEEETDNDASDNYDEIEFNLRAIPLGGYVRFPENYNTTLEYQLEVQADKKRQEIDRIIKERRTSTSDAAYSNGLIASVTNVFLSKDKQREERLEALQIMAEELQKNQTSSSSWWNNLFKTQVKETKDEKSIIIEEDGTISTPPIEYYDDPNLLQNRGWAQRAVVLAGGVVFNLILAFTLYFGELTVGGGMSRPNFDQGAIVSSIPRSDGPSASILNKGDVIIGFNGKSICFRTEWVILCMQQIPQLFHLFDRSTTI